MSRTDEALRIRLFGGFHAAQGDTALPGPPRRETEQLWAYLLLHRGLELPRARVAFEIWPDVSEAEARAKLRRNLHRLLEHLPPADPERPWMTADRRVLRWEPRPGDWLDIDAFDVLCRRVEVLGRGDDGAARDILAQAIALYGGDLLPNLDDSWIGPHRERLRARWLRALDRLGEAQEALGDAAGARASSEALLSADALHEGALARLMRRLAEAGHRGEALARYEAFAAELLRRHGIAPGPATSDLAESLRRGGPADGPRIPLPAAAAAPSRPAPSALPTPLSRLIGRGVEIDAVGALLRAGALLTLVGPGGMGKTRLAVAVARRAAERYPEGARWIDLAAIADPSLVVQSVAAAFHVAPQGERPLLDELVQAARGRQALLVLDNCEHVVDAVAELVVALLATADALTVLATSREPIGLDGETIIPVPPLALPAPSAIPSQATLLASEAVELFVDRVSSRWPQFEATRDRLLAIAAICERLEGLPLAIELAAARVSVLSVEEIAARLDDSLGLLRGRSRSLPERHRTMEAAIAWSYRLLADDERRLLRRLSVFVGGFTLDAAVAVSGMDADDVVDLVAALVDKSLVAVDGASGETRRFHLAEVIRHFGRMRLVEAEDEARVHALHAAYFLALAARAEPHLRGTDAPPWLDLLEREHGNLRAAIQRARERGDLAVGLGFVAAVWVFWNVRSHTEQELVWIEAMLEAADGSDGRGLDRALLAAARRAAGSLAYRRGDYRRALGHWDAGLAIHRALGDDAGCGSMLSLLGMALTVLNDHELAGARCEEALAIARRLGDEHGTANAMAMLAHLRAQQGDHEAARDLYASSLEMLRRIGGSVTSLSNVLRGLAQSADSHGDRDQARRLLQEGIALVEGSANRLTLANWHLLYGTHLAHGNRFEEAERFLKSALAIFREADHEDYAALVLEHLGELETRRGHLDLAWRYLAGSLDVRRRIGPEWSTAHALIKQAEQQLAAGDADAAHDTAVEAMEIAGRLALGDALPRAALVLARLDLAAGRPEAAERRLQPHLGAGLHRLGHLDRAGALEIFARAQLARGAHEDAARLLGAADGLRSRVGCPHADAEARELARATDALRAALGEGRADALIGEGEAVGRSDRLAAWFDASFGTDAGRAGRAAAVAEGGPPPRGGTAMQRS